MHTIPFHSNLVIIFAVKLNFVQMDGRQEFQRIPEVLKFVDIHLDAATHDANHLQNFMPVDSMFHLDHIWPCLRRIFRAIRLSHVAHMVGYSSLWTSCSVPPIALFFQYARLHNRKSYRDTRCSVNSMVERVKKQQVSQALAREGRISGNRICTRWPHQKRYWPMRTFSLWKTHCAAQWSRMFTLAMQSRSCWICFASNNSQHTSVWLKETAESFVIIAADLSWDRTQSTKLSFIITCHPAYSLQVCCSIELLWSSHSFQWLQAGFPETQALRNLRRVALAAYCRTQIFLNLAGLKLMTDDDPDSLSSWNKAMAGKS